MAVEEQIQRLFLTADEIKQLTNWPYEMVEDYLNILRDLVLLASNIDINVDQLDGIEAQVAALDSKTGSNSANINNNAKSIARSEMLISELSARIGRIEAAVNANRKKIQNVEQLAVVI